MPTVHNPTNFKPEDYVVVDYFDNYPPRYVGHPVDNSEAIDKVDMLLELETLLGLPHMLVQVATTPDPLGVWRQRRDDLFPAGAHKCVHCGNTNVRYVVSCLHRPTNTRVCFGDICVDRLDFADRNEFTATMLRKKAAAHNAALRIWRKCEAFLGAHPELVAAIAEAKLPVHARNSFVKNVLHSFYKWGNLSVRQLACVIDSLARDNTAEVAARVPAPTPTAPAPDGRVEVTGTAVSLKSYDGAFGLTTKMLVVLDTGAKVFCMAPHSVDRGDKITFTATFKRSLTDQFFATGKRSVLRTKHAD